MKQAAPLQSPSHTTVPLLCIMAAAGNLGPVTFPMQTALPSSFRRRRWIRA